jgi:hypothetical protein
MVRDVGWRRQELLAGLFPGRFAPGKSAHPSRRNAERDATSAGRFTLNSPDPMIANNSLSTFHQWLLAEPAGPVPARTIILHGDSTVFSDRLIEEIATYLNEYDDDGAGRWLSATSDLVLQISQNQDLRQLLGMTESCQSCPPESACGLRKTLTSLGQRGHVIFRSVAPPAKALDLPESFHAGIGNGLGPTRKCHLVLNPDLMDPGSIAHIIGDVFLEWLHRDHIRAAQKTA